MKTKNICAFFRAAMIPICKQAIRAVSEQVKKCERPVNDVSLFAWVMLEMIGLLAAWGWVLCGRAGLQNRFYMWSAPHIVYSLFSTIDPSASPLCRKRSRAAVSRPYHVTQCPLHLSKMSNSWIQKEFLWSEIQHQRGKLTSGSTYLNPIIMVRMWITNSPSLKSEMEINSYLFDAETITGPTLQVCSSIDQYNPDTVD